MTIPTPSQTIGPFFHFGLEWMGEAGTQLAKRQHSITIYGKIFDGTDQPIPDALVEMIHHSIEGVQFGRAICDPTGKYCFNTAPPAQDDGAVIQLRIFARGLLQPLVTRLYLSDTMDEVLESVDPNRRGTLVATPTASGFCFDIYLQGPKETVFFAW
ncbi:hypothetical protein [Ferrimicrobium sp.]|uniref:hypothetical protein n=1 Tax=Ferrimicrobium sp. TaxID=2926050 RepID=UPI002637BF61|nr:hypothetical protein [Ferrimicrobium sp.]